MKYLLSFFMFLVLALVAVVFLQYQQIDKMQEQLQILNNKLPKFSEAATELEQRIIKLEMEAAYQKGMSNLQTKQTTFTPPKVGVPIAPTGVNPEPVPTPVAQNPATFKDMQKRQ